jgi:UDP-N-acetylmuramate dehydrogenase
LNYRALNNSYISPELTDMLVRTAGSGNVKVCEPMCAHTSFKIGGPADYLVTPKDEESLARIFVFCMENQVPVLVMGNGTNLVVRDKGIRGVVLKLLDNFSEYEVCEDTICAGAGILISRLSRIAMENSLTGLEFAEGIPGTLGGAVTMNAGAYDGEMSYIVSEIRYLDKSGKIRNIPGKEMNFGKRSSFVQKDEGIVLKAVLKLEKGCRENIKAKMDEFNRQRREKQPLELPSAGSVFKRPEGNYAGKLIQDCGLRGCTIGGAMVSDKHCGFIVNSGNASAADVTALISQIRETVKSRFGIELQTEVKIVGEE